MKGFDSQFKDLPDYILKITYQIWENRDVESIMEYYAENIPVRSPSGVIYGPEAVVRATKDTLNEFPDRKLLGEDVIWISDENSGYLSSHRILTKATHMKDGIYGKASGKKLTYRVIADCACKNNQVYDEWLVRDQGAIVKQLGIDPKEYAANLIENEGGPDKAVTPYDQHTPFKSTYIAPILNNFNSGSNYAEILKSIMDDSKKTVEKNYDRAIQQFQPGGLIKHGIEEVIRFWVDLKTAFPDSIFSVEHISFTEEKDQPKKAAIRWSLVGNHNGNGIFGSPSGANVYVMGINHAEFGPRGIKNEWILFDETMIWKQILLKTG
tara:strand:+ start:468 stop:1439 length:972 start_codon:yes stop_codon:yes gene_type:complete